MNIKTEIIQNLREVAGKTGKISRSRFRSSSKRKFASSTVESHFGSFTAARKAAKLAPVVVQDLLKTPAAQRRSAGVLFYKFLFFQNTGDCINM